MICSDGGSNFAFADEGLLPSECLCSGDFFPPDHRNVRHQRYGSSWYAARKSAPPLTKDFFHSATRLAVNSESLTASTLASHVE
jgi:hypothetical protein